MSEKPCVFCDRSQFAERLVGETDEFWIIATLGQITDGGYLLVVPKRHVSCIGAMEESEIKELCAMESQVKAALICEGFVPGIVFEHGIVGQTIQHAHLHIIPASMVISGRIRADFPDIIIGFLRSWISLRVWYAHHQKPYLAWQDADGFSMRICGNPPAPPQYLRTVVAEALGRPERANWRNMDPELDKRLCDETVTRFRKYFI